MRPAARSWPSRPPRRSRGCRFRRGTTRRRGPGRCDPAEHGGTRLSSGSRFAPCRRRCRRQRRAPLPAPPRPSPSAAGLRGGRTRSTPRRHGRTGRTRSRLPRGPCEPPPGHRRCAPRPRCRASRAGPPAPGFPAREPTPPASSAAARAEPAGPPKSAASPPSASDLRWLSSPRRLPNRPSRERIRALRSSPGCRSASTPRPRCSSRLRPHARPARRPRRQDLSSRSR
mmetsp:Transcript_17440/g.39405  ORF Transcript_17440/g.39405 Transcript_17440/m.39405 type:complete len:228 (-) Transcript_17440:32-715(-)